MDWSTISLLQASAVLVAGIAAGFVNALAGGGSLMAIASLLVIGLPSPVANATNRVAIVMQNAVSVRRYHRAGVLEFGDSLGAALPAALGAAVGAFTAVEVPERVFDIALAVVLVLVVVTVFLPQPAARRTEEHPVQRGTGGVVGRSLLYFLVGIYGGFVQSGVGFLLIATITMTRGFDLVRANALKVSIVIVFGAISLAIFAVNGMIVWSAGLLLAAGTMIGAWLGVHAAVTHGSGFVRWVVVASAGAAALRLLGLF